MIKFLLLISTALLFVQCLREENTDLSISIGDVYEKNIGKKGSVILETYEEDLPDIFDTKRDISFTLNISNDETSYEVNCGFWKQKKKSSYSANLYIFCEVDESMSSGNYVINIDEAEQILYKDYLITLKSSDKLEFKKYELDIIDLYADEQTINVEDGKDIYDLKFKIVSYNQEKIFLNSVFILENCQQQNDELICRITRAELEKTLSEKIEYASISYENYISRQKSFPLIPYITIIYDNIQQTDVFVGIKKLIENKAESDTYIAYETNVTNINEVLNLNAFDLEFEIEGQTEKKEAECSFRKYEETPLLLVCLAVGYGKSKLKEIKEEMIISDKYIKYKFRIQPVRNTETIEREKASGTFISWVYPKVLNFTKSDSYIIEYNMEHPNDLKGITFNEKAGELNCETLGKDIKRCTVPKSHFEGLKDGLYFTKHTNHLNTKSISYEGHPIRVIMNTSKGNIITIPLSLLVLFILLF